MLYTYRTDRLILKILGEESAELTTAFYIRNKEHFRPFEESCPENYYTTEYQKRVLAAEMMQFLHSQAVRYYLFLPEHSIPIGTASFRRITGSPEFSCQLGYRLDFAHTGHGYMSEALSSLIPKVFLHYRLHRMEANILPENHTSIRMIERLGFTQEGIARRLFRIGDTYRDHLRYSLLEDDSNFISMYQ